MLDRGSISFSACLVASLTIFVILTIFSFNQFIYSQRCLSPDHNDKDGDDIPDKWEEKGADTNKDGIIDVNLPAINASSAHKDIFLEIDYMKDHQPYNETIQDIKAAFSNAPVCNPDGTNGIKLHIQLDEEIPYKKSLTIWDDFKKLAHNYFGTPAERRNSNDEEITYAKEEIYHYAIFGHTFQDPDTKVDDSEDSGVSEQPGTYILITLGNSSNIPDEKKKTESYQAGTLMHELGHNLNLDHGGKDDINCKPNYLSVMNYAFQFPDPIANRPLDYSRSLLTTLKEKNLNESLGITQSTPPGLTTVYGPGDAHNATTGNSIDWNFDTDFDDAGLSEDINYLKSIYGCEQKPNETLKGYDDWNHLIYDYGAAKYDNDENNQENFIAKIPSITSTLESNHSFSNDDSNITLNDNHADNSVHEELTFDDVKNTNLQLASSISDAIDKLTATSIQNKSNNSILFIPKILNDTEQVKSFYEYKIGNTSRLESTLSEEPINVNDTTIAGYIKSGNIDNAISSLKVLLPTMDSSVGGARSDDKITNSTAQQHIIALINNLIDVLKLQSCTYSNCTIVHKAPNETIQY